MTKSILDAFAGVAYTDDRQINVLFVSKAVTDGWDVWMGLKSLGDERQRWFLEPLLDEVPESNIVDE